jgi:WD40 repeat protein
MRLFAPVILIVAASVGCGGFSPSADGDSSDTPLRTLSGHSDHVCTVAFSPDSKQIASGGADGKIKFWEIETGECLRTFDGHKEWVHSVAYSPDGKLIASCGRDALVKLWDVESGKLRKTFAGHQEVAMSVAYSPDGRLLASCGRDKNKDIRIWDVQSGDRVKFIETGDVCTSSGVLFTLDSKQVIFAGDGLSLWDIESEECTRTFKGHSDSPGAVSMSRNGKWIASTGSFTDHTLRLWDARSGNCLWTKGFPKGESGAGGLMFVSEDTVLVSGHHNGTIRYWNVETGKPLQTIKAHSGPVSTLSADKAGQLLVSGGWDKLIKLWKVPSSWPSGS